MVWHRPGDKLLSELPMVSLLTQICVTRHQWINLYDSIHRFYPEDASYENKMRYLDLGATVQNVSVKIV